MDTVRIIGGKYEILDELGRGGMGVVYRVRHSVLGKIYAMKVLSPDLVAQADLVRRFRREAQVMAQLRHPNIVEVFDIGQDGDMHYFLMEFIEGMGLDRFLRSSAEAIPFARALTITTQIGHALAYAHRQNPAVVHRDIKPANILIENGTERVVVTDFGIAKVLDYDQTQHTRTGAFIGTVRYSAPEQLRGEAELDGRADIYSLGLLLYEMVSGHRLYSDVNEAQLMAQLLGGEKKHPLQFDTPVPVGFQQVVTRAISKDRTQRYPTVEALLSDLKHFEDEAFDGSTGETTIAATNLARPGARQRQGSRRVVASFAFASLLIASVSAWWYLGSNSNEGASSAGQTTPAEITGEPDIDDTEQPALPPLIVSPADKNLTVAACEVVAFEVLDADDVAQFIWRLNGQLANEGNTRYAVSDLQAGSHIVSVEAHHSGETTSFSWEITAQDAINQSQTQEWLSNYASALQTADIGALRKLGFIQNEEQAERIEETLAQRQRYEVAIEDVSIQQLSDSAEMTFRQVERWYDPATFSTIVDHVTHTLTLAREDCSAIVAR